MPLVRQRVSLLGGVNRLQRPRIISEAEAVSTRNIFPVEPGTIGTRKGLGWVKDLFYFDDARGVRTAFPLAVAVPPEDLGIDLVVATRHFSDGIPTSFVAYANSVIVASISLSLVTHRRPQFVHFGNKLYIFSDGHPGVVLQRKPGVEPPAYELVPFAFTDPQNPAFYPAVACTYRGRMVYAQGRRVVFSDAGKPALVGPDVMADNGRHVSIDAMGSDTIVAMQEIMLADVGTPAQAALLVLGRRKAFLITGEPSQTVEIGAAYGGNVSVNEFQNVEGCVSAETLVRTPYGVIWASESDVWMYDEGQIPRRIGTKIRPVLKQTAAEFQYLWHAAYHDGSYRLAVMSDGQGPSHDSPCGEQWWLDLREMVPRGAADARWWGPQVFKVLRERYEPCEAGTYCMAPEIRADREPALLGVEPGLVEQDAPLYGYEGRPGLVLVQYDKETGYDLTVERAFEPFNGNWLGTAPAEIVGSEIECSATLKEFDWDNRMVDKLYLGAQASLFVNDLTRVAVELTLDGGREVATEAVTVAQKGFIAGVSQLPMRMSKEFQDIEIPASSTERHNGRVLQFRVFTRAGWPVTAQNDKVVFAHDRLGAPVIVASVPHGFYETKDDLLAAVAAAMTAAAAAAGEDGVLHIESYTSSPRVALTNTTGERWLLLTDFPLTGSYMPPFKKLAAQLGFDTNAALTPGPVMTAPFSVPHKVCPEIEIADILFEVYPFSRGTP
jgi:hypothetical protein